MKQIKAYRLLRDRVIWFFLAIKSFVIVKPKCVFLIVSLSIALQILGLASFLLPLKMIFILATDKFNSIELFFFNINTKGQLAIFFASIIGSILLLMVFLEKYVSIASQRCSNSIRGLTNKLPSYHNEQQLSKDLYGIVIKALSGFVFIQVIFLLLIYIYPYLFIITFVYWAISIIGLMLFYDHSEDFRSKCDKELNNVLNHIGMFGFLWAFAYVIIDFLSEEPSVVFIYALISLILLRHMNSNILILSQSVNVLNRKQKQFSTIFLNKNLDQSFAQTKKKNSWHLFTHNYPQAWIPKVLEKIINQEKYILLNFEYYQANLPNVLCLLLSVKGSASSAEKKFLLKVFAQKQQLKALQEEELYKHINGAGIAIEFLGSCMFRDYYFHLLCFDGVQSVNIEDSASKKLAMLRRLSSLALPDVFLQKYSNTHEFVYERLSTDVLSLLKTAANQVEVEDITWFEQNMDSIIREITALPLRLTLPDTIYDALVCKGQDVQLLGLYNWSIEPVGYRMKVESEARLQLKNFLNDREYKMAIIVQYLYLFEEHCNKMKFYEAVQNIHDIRKYYAD